MIVEVFYKGTNFEELFDTFWNIKSIKHDGRVFILDSEKSMTKDDAVSLDMETFELRVSY